MTSIIREKRRARGETQAQTAAALGTDRSTYAHIELGRTRPSLSLARRMSQHFDDSIENLFFPNHDNGSIGAAK